MKNRKLIINLFDVTLTGTQSVDAGGVNTVTNGTSGTSYIVNAYGNSPTTTGNDFTPEKAVYYYRVFIKEYEGKQVHGQFGEKVTYPKHSGNVINIRGMTPYPTATTPLQEGITPKGNIMNFYYVEAPVNQYGSYTPITDFARFASRDDVVTKDAEALASQAGRTIEELDRDVLNGGYSVIYAPAIASNGTVTEVTQRSNLTTLCKFTPDLAFRGANYLEVQDAEPFDGGYVAICHPNVKYDIIRHPDFISVVKYQNPERIYRGEIGTIGNVRFVISTFAKVFKGTDGFQISAAVAADPTNNVEAQDAVYGNVYSTLVIAKNAYKTLEIEGEGMTTIIKPLGSGGTSDPLNQRATQGWKTTHGCVITGQTCIVRIESAATLNTVAHSNEELFAALRSA